MLVDPEREVILSVRYADRSGRPLKSYTLVRSVRVGDRFFPGQVRVDHGAEGIVTRIDYLYWLPQVPPPASLFEAPPTDDTAPKDGPFIDRLAAYLTQIGEGSRIEAERALADERVEAWHERFGTMTTNVTVTTGETAEISFEFTDAMAEAPAGATRSSLP